MIPPHNSAASSSSTKLEMHRGAFIVFEGIDRCGKTTQCTRLLNRLLSAGIAATIMRFPDRTTSTGLLINNYLQQTTTSTAVGASDGVGEELNDHTIHLLFSANRWENSNKLKQFLVNGTTVICDRYAYSGVAFSSAKVVEQQDQDPQPVLDIEWCKAPDHGLPAPDCILFLDISQEDAEQRGGYVYIMQSVYCI